MIRSCVACEEPIFETHVHKLPGKGEPRTALEIIAEVKGQRVSFISVHLDHQSEATRIEQGTEIEKVLSARKHPVIMLGDFNATPQSKLMEELEKNWTIVKKSGAPATHPADKPRHEIDYLLIRGLPKVQATSQVGSESVASDHRPLFGTIKMSQ